MTMHLAHPALTTTGRKKGPKKWPSAEAKRQALEQERRWEEYKRKNGITDTKKITARETRGTLDSVYTLRVPPGRETPKINSRDTGWVTCAKTQDQTYTGTKVKGIGTMHKSNAVPIFSDNEAVEISKMRR